jgi:hypothetical protein
MSPRVPRPGCRRCAQDLSRLGRGRRYSDIFVCTPPARGTIRRSIRFTVMTRDIDAPADECRHETERAKRAAAAATDPKAKQRQRSIAKHAEAESIEIENDVAWHCEFRSKSRRLWRLACSLYEKRSGRDSARHGRFSGLNLEDGSSKGKVPDAAQLVTPTGQKNEIYPNRTPFVAFFSIMLVGHLWTIRTSKILILANFRVRPTQY